MPSLLALLSALVGRFVRLRWPHWLVRVFIRAFVRVYRIDTASLAQPLSSFPSLLSFFLREPAPGSRPIDPHPSTIISPVDACVTAHGIVTDNTLLLVKDNPCTLCDLLQTNAPHYAGGAFVMLYLSPRDIHRIYAPCDARVTRCWSVPGTLFSVNPSAVRNRPDTFIRNRRVITELSAPWGNLLMIKVGACNVGRIVTNHPVSPQPSPQHFYRKGDELGRFELGSTVILLFEKNRATLRPDLYDGLRLLIGQPLAFTPSTQQ